MRSLDNIEKSGFRPGEYVGYFDGAWRIVRVSGIWRAIHVNGKYWSVEASTLAELSPLLRTAQEVLK